MTTTYIVITQPNAPLLVSRIPEGIQPEDYAIQLSITLGLDPTIDDWSTQIATNVEDYSATL